MKIKISGIVISLVCAVVALLAVGCEQPHVHTFADTYSHDTANHWFAATCGHEETKDEAPHEWNEEYACITCGYQHEHTYESAWSANDTTHWHESTCGHEDQIGHFELHRYGDDRICSDCDIYVPTEGLKYTLSPNGDYYSVLKGDAVDSEIFIPSTHEGLPVTEIENNAFFEATGITEVHIPDSITVIGDSAFRKCTLLEKAELPSSVTMIGKFAFAECPALTSFTIPNSVTTIEEYVFMGTRNLKELTVPFIGRAVNEQTYNHLGYWFYGSSYLDNKWAVPSSLSKVTVTSGTNVWNSSFYECKNLVEIVIPSSVTKIGRYAFQGCEKLTKITLPAGITSIGGGAFLSCGALATIEYGGTVESWNAFNKGANWDKDAGNFVVVCSNGSIAKPQESGV